MNEFGDYSLLFNANPASVRLQCESAAPITVPNPLRPSIRRALTSQTSVFPDTGCDMGINACGRSVHIRRDHMTPNSLITFNRFWLSSGTTEDKHRCSTQIRETIQQKKRQATPFQL